ncbi:MAG TPA: universal stress protein [Solirubrobacterales bacterium]|nr:universal stress protein [Solirubrobacterales bacterium]
MNDAAERSSADRPALLCFDGSPDAAEAIHRAGDLIGGGSAILLYVWLPPSALLLAGRAVTEDHPLGPAIEEFDAAARKEAERVAAKGVEIASRAGFDAKPVTRRASHAVWRAILEVAEEHEVRAVVVGSHGRSAAASAVLGSVSHGVVNHCRRPVLVAPCSGDHAASEA